MSLPMGGDSSFYLELYARYRKDRHSVPADWALLFDAEDAPTLSASSSYNVADIFDAYRRFGHLEAQLDPLRPNGEKAPALERLRQGLVDAAPTPNQAMLAGERQDLTVQEAEVLARGLYASHVALEVEHLGTEEERDWWYAAFETAYLAEDEAGLLSDTLVSLVLVDTFETFMRTKYPTKKRFGSEGAETAIVFLREIFRSAPAHDVGTAVVGGMHRGRLATLATAFSKNPATMIAEIMGRDLSGGTQKTGDVPYHLGYAGDVTLGDEPLRVMLMPHPSHLMVVAPVTLGLARAVRDGASGEDPKTLSLMMHTDAAFAGQGLASELLQIGGLAGYSAGGTIHLVVNNQLGFTTLPSEGRSARYCTDIGKSVGVPILHVNGDDPVAVARAGRLALMWQQAFEKDVIVDLVCYRRYGHNELDEPAFTQPDMCAEIAKRPRVRRLFTDVVRAVDPTLLARADNVEAQFKQALETGFEGAAHVQPNEAPLQSGDWEGKIYADENKMLARVVTGVSFDRLQEIGLSTSTIPDDFKAHPKVRKFYQARAETLETGADINFATAEALAFATLLADGSNVRMSGQDTVRGTFTQRHLRVHAAESGRTITPLENAAALGTSVTVINSPLSEYGVLGFEYGHSLYDCNQLTVWEAQFGDFLNGAQVVVDQYIVSAESKWGVKSGLVVMLPHGLEGQGPDHSSARIERIGQLCADANIVLAQPSTPANLFHLLRRQIVAPWRKPLFLIAPKSLLRRKSAVSDLNDMADDTSFDPVLAAPCPHPERVRRVVLCSGKVFYDLEQARVASPGKDTIYPIRIEQLYPFPAARLRAALKPFKNAVCVWLQDEPANQGPWPFVRDRLIACDVRMCRETPLISRPEMSVSAGGSVERHEREQEDLIKRALGIKANRAENAA